MNGILFNCRQIFCVKPSGKLACFKKWACIDRVTGLDELLNITNTQHLFNGKKLIFHLKLLH